MALQPKPFLAATAALATLSALLFIGSVMAGGGRSNLPLRALLIQDPVRDTVPSQVHASDAGLATKIDAALRSQFDAEVAFDAKPSSTTARANGPSSVTAASTIWTKESDRTKFTSDALFRFGYPRTVNLDLARIGIAEQGFFLSARLCILATGAPGPAPETIPTIANAYVVTCAPKNGELITGAFIPSGDTLVMLVTNELSRDQLTPIAERQYNELASPGSVWTWAWKAAGVIALLGALISIELRKRQPRLRPAGRLQQALSLRRRPLLYFVGSKVGTGVAVMIVVTFVTTALAGLLPGYVATNLFGDTGPLAESYDYSHGYQDAIVVQYWHWLYGMLHGDLGTSLHAVSDGIFGNLTSGLAAPKVCATCIQYASATRFATVNGILEQRTPVTLEIALLTLLIATTIAVPMAMVSASRPGGLIDHITTTLSALASSLPVYISGVFLVDLFVSRLRWFPSQGWVPLTTNVVNNLRDATLPVLTLVLTVFPVLLRILRADLVSLTSQEFVIAARSRGLPYWYVLTRHMFRPAAAGFITYAGIALGEVVSGSFLVEYFYSIPGLGTTFWDAVSYKDIPLLQGMAVVTAFTFVVVNLLVDLSYRWLDPRVRVM